MDALPVSSTGRLQETIVQRSSAGEGNPTLPHHWVPAFAGTTIMDGAAARTGLTYGTWGVEGRGPEVVAPGGDSGMGSMRSRSPSARMIFRRVERVGLPSSESAL